MPSKIVKFNQYQHKKSAWITQNLSDIEINFTKN